MAQEEEVLGKAYDSRLMKRLLGYLRPYKWQVVVALISIILKAGADVLGPFLTKTAIDKYLSSTAHHSILDRFLSSSPLVGIAQLGFAYFALLLISFGLEYTQMYLMLWIGQKVMFDFRSQIFRHLQHMHIGFYDKNPVGRLVTRVTSDVDALNEMFTSGVVAIFEDIFVLAGILMIMLGMSWWLALITFSVLPLIFWATMVFRKSVRDSYRRIRTAIARINSHLQEHVTGMVVLQLFNREKRAYRSFDRVNAQHMEAYKDAILAYALYYPVVEIFSSVAIAMVIYFGGFGVLRNAVTIGVLTAFMQYAQRFFRPIQDLSDKYNILQGAMASSERVFKLLDTSPTIVSPAIKTAFPEGAVDVEFDRVWFAYNGEDWVLKDVSFHLAAGENIAIVGHTGAGKTTLTNLLLRFYDVQRGAIRIGGVDVRQFNLLDLRRDFGVVLQDAYLFPGTLESNIRLGTPGLTREDVRRAADQVNLSGLIDELPERFDTPVRERGNGFSTGQKQLVNFARALAHSPRILILDEATSSVDTETELRVRDALTRLVTNRTSLVIAHRLSTIQSADRILVMHRAQ